jgi:plasmid segregation protein ParM
MSPVVRAIDVGYSWTKYVLSGESLADICCDAFRSVAPRASNRELGLDARSRRNTVHVPVDGFSYEVGPEADMVQETYQSMPLDDSYAETPEYLALVRGALRLMGVNRVDFLMVGLPVALFRQRRHALERRLVGRHTLGDGHSVSVRNVKVLAQPVGALASAAIEREELQHLKGARNLIVDPG